MTMQGQESFVPQLYDKVDDLVVLSVIISVLEILLEKLVLRNA